MLKYQGVPFKPAKVNLVDLQKLRVSSLVMSSSCANVVLWIYNYIYTNHISLQHVPVVSNNYHQLGIKSQFPNPNSKYSKRSSHMENVVNLVEFCISISEHLLNMSPKLTQKKQKSPEIPLFFDGRPPSGAQPPPPWPAVAGTAT